MNEIIFIVEDDLEGGYTARAVGHSIFTDGENEAELKANVKEALAVHFDEAEAPKMIRLHFQRDEVLVNYSGGLVSGYSDEVWLEGVV